MKLKKWENFNENESLKKTINYHGEDIEDDELYKYLKEWWRNNNHVKYQKYFDEWFENLTDNQIDYFRKDIN